MILCLVRATVIPKDPPAPPGRVRLCWLWSPMPDPMTPKGPRPKPSASLRLPRPTPAPRGVRHSLAPAITAYLRNTLTQAANPLGNFSIEAPTAVAWNSTAVNRCSGAQPRAASRPQRPTDSTAPAVDRQGFTTVNVQVHSGTGIRRPRVWLNSDYHIRNTYVRPPRKAPRGAPQQHGSPSNRHHVVPVHRYRQPWSLPSTLHLKGILGGRAQGRRCSHNPPLLRRPCAKHAGPDRRLDPHRRRRYRPGPVRRRRDPPEDVSHPARPR